MSGNSTFAFRAVRPNGTFETGVLEAPSRDAAVALIGRRGAFAIHVSPHEGEQRAAGSARTSLR